MEEISGSGESGSVDTSGPVTAPVVARSSALDLVACSRPALNPLEESTAAVERFDEPVVRLAVADPGASPSFEVRLRSCIPGSIRPGTGPPG